jgi:hypothetical protein
MHVVTEPCKAVFPVAIVLEAKGLSWLPLPRAEARLERKVADLEALGAELRQVIVQCSQRTIAECHILEALSPGSSVRA